jgi:uncharacterized protein YukE
VSSETNSYSVDAGELDDLAAKAAGHAEALRRSWRRDWFEDDKWPEHDQLRLAVIAYRRSLRAAMERLGDGAEQMAAHLRQSADLYRDQEYVAEGKFERIGRTMDSGRADGGADA